MIYVYWGVKMGCEFAAKTMGMIDSSGHDNPINQPGQAGPMNNSNIFYIIPGYIKDIIPIIPILFGPCPILIRISQDFLSGRPNTEEGSTQHLFFNGHWKTKPKVPRKSKIPTPILRSAAALQVCPDFWINVVRAGISWTKHSNTP